MDEKKMNEAVRQVLKRLHYPAQRLDHHPLRAFGHR